VKGRDRRVGRTFSRAEPGDVTHTSALLRYLWARAHLIPPQSPELMLLTIHIL
jgi:hypothetical protein